MNELDRHGGSPPEGGKRPKPRTHKRIKICGCARANWATCEHEWQEERHKNNGLAKVCKCQRREWSRCDHAWYLAYKPKGKPGYRFSLDAELGRHIGKKEDAETEAEKIRLAIKAGTFRRRSDPPQPMPAPETTFRKLGELWLERRGRAQTKNETGYLNRIAAFVPPGQMALGDQLATAITEDMLEMFFVDLEKAGRKNGTLNKYRQFLMPMLRWGVKKRYLTQHPVTDESEVIKHKSEKGARRKERLDPDVVDANGTLVQEGEERRLLRFANPTLQRLIIGALETAMRFGELQNLRWQDVSLPRRELKVRAETSKTSTERTVIISERLAAVLEMARVGPDGKDRQPMDYVFGDGAGRKLGSYKKAWATCVLKAHGYAPKWGKHGKLAPESRAALRAINLHFHDLRHEAGSRLIEGGMPVHEVKDQLGHSDLKQTTTYLNATLDSRKASMRRVEEQRARCKGVVIDPPIEHRRVHNGDERVDAKLLVN